MESTTILHEIPNLSSEVLSNTPSAREAYGEMSRNLTSSSSDHMPNISEHSAPSPSVELQPNETDFRLYLPEQSHRSDSMDLKTIQQDCFQSRPTSKSKQFIRITTRTSIANSHDLFDYEDRNIIDQYFKATCPPEPCDLVRINNTIRLLSSEQMLAGFAKIPEAQILLSIKKAKDGYFLHPPERKATRVSEESAFGTPYDDALWLVIRDLRDKKAIVRVDDQIKLGKYLLKIKEAIHTVESDPRIPEKYILNEDDDIATTIADREEVSTNHTAQLESEIQFSGRCALFPSNADSTRQESQLKIPPEKKVSIVGDQDVGAPLCRVCLSGPFETEYMDHESNPLIAPCNCKGSTEWIHAQCLKTWIYGSCNITDMSSSYFLKSFQCELCKVVYPKYARICAMPETDPSEPLKSRLQNTGTNQTVKTDAPPGMCSISKLFNLPCPEPPYLILEPVNRKGIHVVGLAERNGARIGRGHNSAIHLPDISVSRYHAKLSYCQQPAKRQSRFVLNSSGYSNEYSGSVQSQFVLEDIRSKFGTLLKTKSPLRLEVGFPPIVLQAGRTVITVSMHRRWRLSLPPCILQIQDTLSSEIFLFFRQPHVKNIDTENADSDDRR